MSLHLLHFAPPATEGQKTLYVAEIRRVCILRPHIIRALSDCPPIERIEESVLAYGSGTGQDMCVVQMSPAGQLPHT